MTNWICETWNLVVGHAFAETIQQPQTEVTDLSFASKDKGIPNSTPTNQG